MRGHKLLFEEQFCPSFDISFLDEFLLSDGLKKLNGASQELEHRGDDLLCKIFTEQNEYHKNLMINEAERKIKTLRPLPFLREVRGCSRHQEKVL